MSRFGIPQPRIWTVVHTNVSCARLGPKTVAYCPEWSPIHPSCLAAYAYIHRWISGTQLWDLLRPRLSNQSWRNSIEETYCVLAWEPKSNESVDKGMVNQGRWEGNFIHLGRWKLGNEFVCPRLGRENLEHATSGEYSQSAVNSPTGDWSGPRVTDQHHRPAIHSWLVSGIDETG